MNYVKEVSLPRLAVLLNVRVNSDFPFLDGFLPEKLVSPSRAKLSGFSLYLWKLSDSILVLPGF